jgi:hypothetical protein
MAISLIALGFLLHRLILSWNVWLQVYALTKERDTLRREHNKKSDAAALLKEKDEIINQVMAEGRATQAFISMCNECFFIL